jgi:hypothetical protein
MKPGFFDYIKAAFNAKPFGMFIAPNWAGLAAVAMLGWKIHTGFWLIGAGVELAYLLGMATNPRFRKAIDAEFMSKKQGDVAQKKGALLTRLSQDGRANYQYLEQRCREILDLQVNAPEPVVGLESQGEALAKLLWIYLRLLVGREALHRMIHENEAIEKYGNGVEERLKEVEKQLVSKDLASDLRKSLTSQAEVLKQRLASQKEARSKLAYLDSEIARIQDQVSLLREQAVLPAGHQGLSERIDGVSASLGGTSQWIQEQRSIYGKMEDMVAEPPPLQPTAQTN